MKIIKIKIKKFSPSQKGIRGFIKKCHCSHHKSCSCPRASSPTSYCRHRESNWNKQGINLTYYEYEFLKKKQNNKCAICKIFLTSKLETVDHNHKNGKIRGLLCRPCNSNLNKANKFYKYLHQTRYKIYEYVVLGIINTLVVHLVYSPYVILWLHLDSNQYNRWLIGGLPMSLTFGWFFIYSILWSKNRFFPEDGGK